MSFFVSLDSFWSEKMKKNVKWCSRTLFLTKTHLAKNVNNSENFNLHQIFIILVSNVSNLEIYYLINVLYG